MVERQKYTGDIVLILVLRYRKRGEFIMGKSGYVYVIKERQTDKYKIGVTSNKDIRYRLGQLQVGNPNDLISVYFEKHINYISVEKQLHYIFKQYNSSGEWFILTDQLYTLLRELLTDGNKRYSYYRNDRLVTSNSSTKTNIETDINYFCVLGYGVSDYYKIFVTRDITKLLVAEQSMYNIPVYITICIAFPTHREKQLRNIVAPYFRVSDNGFYMISPGDIIDINTKLSLVSREAMHSVGYTSDKYVCPFCGKETVSQKSMNRHLDKHLID